MTLQATLLEIEESYWNAAGDADFYRKNLADDALMVFMVGILEKGQVIQAQEDADRWTGFTIDDPRVIDIADDVAALVYTTRAVRAGTEIEYVAAVSSTYTRRNGNWILILHHQTPLNS